MGQGNGHSAERPRSKPRPRHGAAANLPRHVVEDLTRVTAKDKTPRALEALGEAWAALADGRNRTAFKQATRAKELAPRDATTRETLGVAAYRCGEWEIGLRELRTYRRMSGETSYLPVEMDIARALGRDPSNAWQELQRRGGSPAVMKEGRVVYASHLIDEGELEKAYEIARPQGIATDPFPADLRVWYVTARVAALLGRRQEAVRYRNAILEHDPSFPGMDELEEAIAAAG